MIDKIVQQNTLTLVRSLLALNFFITLLFTDVNDLIPKYHLDKISESDFWLMKLNYFTWFDDALLPYIFSIIVLIIIIAGYYPRVLCFFQVWIAYSIFYSTLIVEGGDQINVILSLLLVPIAILDNRKNGWISTIGRESRVKERKKRLIYNLLKYNAQIALYFIKIQIAVLYLNAGVSKIFASDWMNGTAVYYWFFDPMFGASENTQHVFGFLFKNDLTVSLLNWSVILLEILLAFSLFFKQKEKYVFFCLGVIFHFSIVIFHGLVTFFIAMLGCLIIYLCRMDLSIKQNLIKIKSSFL